MNVKHNDSAEHTVERIINHIQEMKGEDIVVIDLRGVTSVCDFFVITTGTSNIHIKAIADYIHEKMKKEDSTLPWHTEGYEAQKWVLLDYVDVVVHVFDAETRSYFSLEKLWDDAKIKRIETED